MSPLPSYRSGALVAALASSLLFTTGADAQSPGRSSETAADPAAPSTQAPEAAVTPLLTKPLGGIDGKEGLMLTVEYAPGVSSPPHRHNANTFVYVLEGSVVMQVAGGEEVTLTEGQTFYESPTDIHTVSRNASDTAPAKILVFLVKDRGAPVTLPAQ
ncbi:MAG TPA: cupin domain-containing protein [Gammaproteobacteria bacterium]